MQHFDRVAIAVNKDGLAVPLLKLLSFRRGGHFVQGLPSYFNGALIEDRIGEIPIEVGLDRAGDALIPQEQ